MVNLIRNWLGREPRIFIEPARDRDLETLSEIHHEGFSRGWSDGEFEALLAQGVYSCLVARLSGEAAPPAGFVLIKTVEEEAEVISLAVKRRTRGLGIARALMDAAIRGLQADRAQSLFLEVGEANQAAIALYGKLGFKTIGQREGYYPGRDHQGSKPSTALVMSLDLG